MKKRSVLIISILVLLTILIVVSQVYLSNVNKNYLKVTLEHPFYINGNWIKASDLKVGDELTTADGKKALIKNIKQVNKPAIVFNLNVNYPNNYFVEGILVHNKPVRHYTDTLIDSSRSEYSIRRLDGEKLRTAYGSNKVTRENIAKLFSNEYMPGQRGAKAVVFYDMDGIAHVRIWSTGEGKIGNGIHHRDAIATLIDEEADGLMKRALDLDSEELLELAEKRKRIARDLSTDRRQMVYPSDILENSQGFQLILGSDGRVKYFDVDSSITASQISRGEMISAAKLSEMITELHNSITPELRGYKIVRIRGLGKMKLDGELKLPDGLRAVELLD